METYDYQEKQGYDSAQGDPCRPHIKECWRRLVHPVTTGEKMVITACDGYLVDTNPRGCSCEGPTSWAKTQVVSGYIPSYVVSKRCSVNLCHGSESARFNCQDGGCLDQTAAKKCVC